MGHHHSKQPPTPPKDSRSSQTITHFPEPTDIPPPDPVLPEPILTEIPPPETNVPVRTHSHSSKARNKHVSFESRENVPKHRHRSDRTKVQELPPVYSESNPILIHQTTNDPNSQTVTFNVNKLSDGHLTFTITI